VFRRDVQQVKDLILRSLREQGLEMPLQQKRLVEAWPIVAGPVVARYTLNTYIYNQTLYVRLSNPALRSDLSMRRKELTEQLNKYVGNQVITDIRFG
jgi:predicted nucleic acid-binding Zn ribbon protein